MKFFFCLFFLLNSLVHAETHTVKLGNTPIKIIKHKGKGKTFIHLHENEVTALAAASLYVLKEGGSLITLKHSGRRNVVFYLKKVRYEFDPNRIFSDKGIRHTLKHFGHYSKAAHTQVKKLAHQILVLLPKGKIVAVHNNRHYSMKDYFPKHAMAKEVKTYYFSAKSNYRNFYFVTQRKEFNRLKKMHFNVALQAKNARDDGSLSYRFANKNYINIETAYNALLTQIKMLNFA